MFCVLIKRLYWRRRLIGERDFFGRGAYWREELIGQRGSSEKEAFFFVGGLFWERGLIRERSFFGERLFWERVFFVREAHWREGLLK